MIHKNAIYNLGGALLPLALSIVTIPVYINCIGEDRYGVLAIVWLVLGYFGLFDLGLGAATTQRIATLAGSSPQQRSKAFWTALAMNGTLGVMGGLVIWPLSLYGLVKMFTFDASLQHELAKAIPWFVIAVPLLTLSGVLAGALQGRSRFLELNIISAFGSILVQLLPLASVWLHGPSLDWLLLSVILARAVTLAALFWLCGVHIFFGQPCATSGAHAKDLLRFGGWVTVTAIIGPMMVILDRFVIGTALGPKSVTYYTVPFQLAERSGILPGAVASALFPRLAESEQYAAYQLAIGATRALAVLMTPIIIIGLLFVEPFLRWWLSADFALRAALTGQILLLGFWINSFARIPFTQLQAAGRPDVVAKCHLAEVVPYLALLYLGLHFWGVPGAAVVFTLRAFADCVLLMRSAGSLRIAVSVLFVPLILLLVGLAIAVAAKSRTPTWWFLATTLLLTTLLWSWINAPEQILLFVSGLKSKLRARRGGAII